MTEDGPTDIDYSIVIPVYFNEGALSTTLASIMHEVIENQPSLTPEIIFVDDGSGDGSLKELLELRKAHPDIIKVIKLTRNFGQPCARLAGLSRARGRCVVSMSADGQDPASLVNDMLEAHFEEGCEVVACARVGRDESWYRVLTSRIFYKLMQRLSFPNMPKGGFDYILLGRKALDAVLRNQEAHPFFQGQILWTGFKPKFIEYHRMEREVGQSRWTFGKKLTLLIDGVLSYSFAPIRLMSLSGMAVALAGFVLALSILIRRVLLGTTIPGWSGTMIVLLVMGGIQMLMLGVIGEYIWRTLAQARNREPYVIEKIYE